MGCSTMIFVGTVAYLVIGLFSYVAWQITGNPAWVDQFFRVPGSLLAVCLSLVQLVFAVRVRSQFSRGESLYLAWQLISLSAACDVLSVLTVQVFSATSPWNPLAHFAAWSENWARSIRQVGLFAGGPLRFTLLAAGLLFALRMYRQSGFLGRFTPVDWLLLAVAACYLLSEAADVGIALQHGKKPGWGEIAGWPVDPLLCLLLAEAILLYRSARRMGSGWVGRCWIAFSVGIVLVILGDVSIWANAYGYLPYPWSNIEWYLWLPAGAAFAMAPVYQMEVIQRAASR